MDLDRQCISTCDWESKLNEEKWNGIDNMSSLTTWSHHVIIFLTIAFLGNW